MFKYCIIHTVSNNMHEHIVHAQHIQHKSRCMGVTPVQSFGMGFVYIFSVLESLKYMIYI